MVICNYFNILIVDIGIGDTGVGVFCMIIHMYWNKVLFNLWCTTFKPLPKTVLSLEGQFWPSSAHFVLRYGAWLRESGVLSVTHRVRDCECG